VTCASLLLTFALSASCHADADLAARVYRYVENAGYKPNMSASEAIVKASRIYEVNPFDLARLAILESSFDPGKRMNKNSNGTRDFGLFQINDVKRHETCNEFDIETLEGNVMCAGKIVSEIKAEWSTRDPRWIARFHSKTPVIKHEYYRRFASL
jgi:hypothetical protein